MSRRRGVARRHDEAPGRCRDSGPCARPRRACSRSKLSPGRYRARRFRCAVANESRRCSSSSCAKASSTVRTARPTGVDVSRSRSATSTSRPTAFRRATSSSPCTVLRVSREERNGDPVRLAGLEPLEHVLQAGTIEGVTALVEVVDPIHELVAASLDECSDPLALILGEWKRSPSRPATWLTRP